MSSPHPTDILTPLEEAASTLETTVDTFGCLDGGGLPANFGEVAGRLPLVRRMLTDFGKHIKRGGPGNRSINSWEDFRPYMVECNNGAKRLQSIFTKVVPERGTEEIERVYQAAAGPEGRVELVLLKMLQGMLNFAKASVIPSSQVKELSKAVKEVAGLESSIKTVDSPQTYMFNNYGSGAQNNQTGSGTQNNNNGGGYQMTGPIRGNLNFGYPPAA